MTWSALAAVIALLAAGCLRPPGITAGDLEADERPLANVVVALTDSGTNPYHARFRAAGLQLPTHVMAANPEPIRLTFDGTYEENVKADEAFWKSVERGKLYWFQDTRVLAVSYLDPRDSSTILDLAAHGTGTSGLILEQAPDALVLMMASSVRALPETDFSSLANATIWAVEQPWVDLLSMSAGFPAPAPGAEALPPAMRKATETGKLIVAGAGNLPIAPYHEQIAGPPWVVAVGGVDQEERGETAGAGKGADFVADFFARAPCADHVSAYCDYLGTSFATPMVAGALARAVSDLRVATGHVGGIRDGALVDAGLRVTNADLREALNRTAVYWNTTDYRPAPPPLDEPLNLPWEPSAPIGPAPWTQMGWGYVGPGHGAEVARRVLAGELPDKPPEAVAHMEAIDRARWEYWSRQGLET